MSMKHESRLNQLEKRIEALEAEIKKKPPPEPKQAPEKKGIFRK